MERYLPNTFPLRYAIVLDGAGDNEEDDEKDRALRAQLYTYLQRTPLVATDLRLNFSGFEIRTSNVAVASLTRLGASKEWHESTSRVVQELFPEGQLTTSTGIAFLLGLYSYRGALEIPAFYRMINAKDSFEKQEKIIGREGHRSAVSIENRLLRLYRSILNGEIDEATLWSVKQEKPETLHINAPISDLWQLLDNDQSLEGSLPPKPVNNGLELPNQPGTNEGRIPVAVCRTWDSLFLEELWQLHRHLNYCNNCGHALERTTRKTAFCQPGMESYLSCRKARERKRKNSSRENKGHNSGD